MRLGEHYQKQGDFQQAMREYRSVMKAVPEDDAPYARMADLLIQQNEYAAADSLLQIPVAFGSNSPFIFAKLGLVKFLQHDFGEAAHHFKRALYLNQQRAALPVNDLAAAHYYLALSQIQRGDSPSAQTHLVEVLRHQPQHSEARRLHMLLQKGIDVKLQF